MGETDESVELPELTAKQKAFVQQYVIDNNATQAAIRAGYAVASANVEGSRLLAKANISAAVEKIKAERMMRVNVTQEQVLQEMALLANSSVEHYYVTDDGNLAAKDDAPAGAMRAISSVRRRKIVKENAQTGDLTITYEIEFRLWDKPTPLKLMGRHTGLFPNRVEVTGRDGRPVELTAVSSDELMARAKKLAELAEGLPDEK